MAQAPESCTATRTSNRATHAARSGLARNPRAGSACGRHRNPSSTPRHLRLGPERPASVEFHSSQESSRPDNFFLTARFYLNETTPLSHHLGSFGSPFFARHPGAVFQYELVLLSALTVSRSEAITESKDLVLPRGETGLARNSSGSTFSRA